MKIEPLDHFEKILLLKRYSKQTIDNYVSHLRLAQVFFDNKNFTSISDKEWFNYLFHLVHYGLPVYARTTYKAKEIINNANFDKTNMVGEDGSIVIDLDSMNNYTKSR